MGRRVLQNKKSAKIAKHHNTHTLTLALALTLALTFLVLKFVDTRERVPLDCSSVPSWNEVEPFFFPVRVGVRVRVRLKV